MKSSFLAAATLAAALGWAATPASAQTAAPAPAMAAPAPAKPIRLHGTITGVHADHVDFTSLGGAASTVALTPDTRFVQLRKTTLRTVKTGDFVGVGAMEGPNDTLTAVEVSIFPEAMRGTGEGNRPWEAPKSEMTNGTVGKIDAKSAKSLTVGYKGGEKTIAVVSRTVIVRLVPATAAALKKGSKVSINAIKTGDASYKAIGVNIGGVGAKGLTPPT